MRLPKLKDRMSASELQRRRRKIYAKRQARAMRVAARLLDRQLAVTPPDETGEVLGCQVSQPVGIMRWKP